MSGKAYHHGEATRQMSITLVRQGVWIQIVRPADVQRLERRQEAKLDISLVDPAEIVHGHRYLFTERNSVSAVRAGRATRQPTLAMTGIGGCRLGASDHWREVIGPELACRTQLRVKEAKPARLLDVRCWSK